MYIAARWEISARSRLIRSSEANLSVARITSIYEYMYLCASNAGDRRPRVSRMRAGGAMGACLHDNPAFCGNAERILRIQPD